MLRGGARTFTSIYRACLTALNQWAQEDPPERVMENACRITLYSTSQRQVKAAPRKPPPFNRGGS